MVKEAWDSVSATCIINCFRKAGFKKEFNPDSLEENNPSVENDLPTPPPGLSNEEFSEFVDIDENVECVEEEEVTDQDIVSSIQNKKRKIVEDNLEEDDGEPDEDEVENISVKTAAKDILGLQKYISQTNEMDWDFS